MIILIFTKENLIIEIEDILELHQSNITTRNTLKNYCAFSIRENSDTQITTSNDVIELPGNTISYFPSDVYYQRKSKKDDVIIFHFKCLNFMDTEFQVVKIDDFTEIIDFGKKALDAWTKKSCGYKNYATGCFYNILAIVNQINSSCKKNKDDVISKSVDYIHSNFKNSRLTLEEVANISHISQVYFRKRFNNLFGISPNKYITNMRIQYATSLIKSNYYSIKEIAYMSGFNDVKYFSAVYKKTVGFPPSLFKKHIKKT